MREQETKLSESAILLCEAKLATNVSISAHQRHLTSLHGRTAPIASALFKGEQIDFENE
jgi:hypothetical protein